MMKIMMKRKSRDERNATLKSKIDLIKEKVKTSKSANLVMMKNMEVCAFFVISSLELTKSKRNKKDKNDEEEEKLDTSKLKKHKQRENM